MITLRMDPRVCVVYKDRGGEHTLSLDPLRIASRNNTFQELIPVTFEFETDDIENELARSAKYKEVSDAYFAQFNVAVNKAFIEGYIAYQVFGHSIDVITPEESWFSYRLDLGWEATLIDDEE